MIVVIHSGEVVEQADITPRLEKRKMAEDIYIVESQVPLKGEGMKGNNRNVRINRHQTDSRRGKPPNHLVLGLTYFDGKRGLGSYKLRNDIGGRYEICCE